MTNAQLVATVGFGLFFFGVGFISVLWPEKVQTYALKRCTKFYFWPNPFLGWMKTPSYVAYLRIMGGLFTAVSLFVLWVALGTFIARLPWIFVR